MNTWVIVGAAALLGYVVKLAGYLVPERLVEGQRSSRVVGLLPVALLAALVVKQLFEAGDGGITIDARAGGIVAAVVLLTMRANFLVVVTGAAVVAAALRALGIG